MHAQNLAHIPTILLTATRYVDHEDEMLAEMVVRQPHGLRPMEALKAIRALVNLLEPQ